MKIEQTKLAGVYLITPHIHEDYRGELAETYNEAEYAKSGLNAHFVEYDTSMARHNVLKGMHGDDITTKLIEVVYGEVYAVIVNCDETSPDFGKWQSFILSETNHRALYIPPKYGNGYYVLSDKCVYLYRKSEYFIDGREFTYAWNDPRFGIVWPVDNPILGERDK
jgi:dTDP-4-dehydrorhamnose 3,5-epimerase